CQFVVNDKFDYTAHLINPDLLVDWENIEEIRLSEPETPSCPICLYPPVAAQITKCGHVFCYACILHYLSLSDKQWRKCPICYESVYKNQLRSVLTNKAKLYRTGEKITFRLMFREKGSNIVAPVSNSRSENSSIFNRFEDSFARFSKLLLTTNQQTLISTIEREKVELECQYAQEKDQPESCFILEALEAINCRKQTLRSLPVANSNSKDSDTPKDAPRTECIETFIDAFNDISVMAPNENAKNEKTSTIGENNTNNMKNKPLTEKIYYFYQGQWRFLKSLRPDDGQPIFMHPLNVHCLIMEYGSLARAPELITGIVVEADTFTMCPDVRKHYRYLGHLPLTSVFSLIEFKFDESDGQVSKKTLECFKDEFEKRDRFRARKLDQEKKQQERCQLWEKAVLHNASSIGGNNSTLSIDLPSSTYVHSVQSQIEASLTSSDSNLIENINRTLPSTSGVQTETSAASSLDEHGLSFAQMLKCGKPKQNVRIVADPKDSEEYAPSALTSYRAEFGDAIKLALENFNSKNNDGNASNGKKKKKKGKILFTL
uniref:E3 ubiquitin-protein ligase RNF10 n=1 Tax=Romanomermis culicivorax TaxID=13658 RepID=A0A915L505_ROMCU